MKDNPTGITAYIIYKVYDNASTLLRTADAETIVMERTREDGTVVMSICTPDLGITEKGYTTKQASQVLKKRVELNGEYQLAQACADVEVVTAGGKTVITASCCHGQPVEFILKK